MRTGKKIHSRNKGVRAEREVAIAFEAAGFLTHGLEGQGDHLIVPVLDDARCPPLHLEVKRQERLRLTEWIAQAEREADPRFVPLVIFRQSREPWRVVLRLDAFLEMVK